MARRPNPGGHPNAGWDPAPWIRGFGKRDDEADEFALLDGPPAHPPPFLTATFLLLWFPVLVIAIVALMGGNWLGVWFAVVALTLILLGGWQCLTAIGRHARYGEWFRNQPEGHGTYQSRPGENGWYRNEPRG